MATGSTAQALNATDAITLGQGDVGTPPPINTQLKQTLQGTSLIDKMGNYLKDTNWGNVGEAILRANPITAPVFWARDAQEGTFQDNMRMSLGQATRMPTDIAGQIVGLPAAVSGVKTAVFGGAPLPGAEGSAAAANAIDEFGRSIAEPIAGRPLGNELLRGTPAEMAANWQRTLGEAIVPLPTKVVSPVLNAASTLTRAADAVLTGTNIIEKSTALAGRTLEALTPLAVSSSPSAKVMGINAGIQGTLAPLQEAANAALAQQQQADAVAKKGTELNTQGWTQAGGVSDAVDSITKPPNVIQAGGLPTTGNPADDLFIAGSIIAGGFAAWKYRNVVQRIATGYDPKVRTDLETVQPWYTKLTQQTSKGDAAVHNTLKEALRADPNYTRNQVDDMIAKNKEDVASRSGAALTTKEDLWMRDGRYMDSSVQSVPGNDLFKAHGELSDAQKEGFNQLAWARQELSDRDRMMAAQLNRSATNPLYTSTPARNLPGYTYRDLENIVNTHNADPEIQNVYKMYRDVLDKAGDYMADQKGMHPTEWAKFHTENPFYVPNKLGGQKNFMDPRTPVKTADPAGGLDVPRGKFSFDELGNAMSNVPAYMDEVFRRTEGMKGKRDFFEYAQDAMAKGNKYLTTAFPQLGNKTMLGRNVKLGPEAADRTVTWRDSNGTKQTTEVNDIVLRDALNGMGNPSVLQLQSGLFGQLTKYYESGAVGPLSLFNMTMFPAKSALYSMTMGSIAPTERGIAKGYLDRLAQDHLGIRLPGDISGIAGLPWHTGKNIIEMLGDRGARALHNAVITNGMLTKAFDPVSLEAASQRLSNWYRTTHSYAMKEGGLAGPSSQNAIDTTRMYSDPAGALRPRTGFLGAAEQTHDFINDLMRAVSSSPAGVMRAVNPGVEPWRLNSSIRNLSGDPGRSGAWRNAKGIAQAINATPWGNVYIQAIGKMMEAGTSVDKALYSAQGAATIGTAIAAASMWNASLGPEYTQHQHFERGPDDIAQNVYIGIPGKPPSQGLYVPVDPGVRPIKLAADALAGLHLGLFDGTLFKPGNEVERNMYSEMVHHQYGPPVEGSVARSMLQQFLIPPVPGIAQSLFALGGVQLRNYGDTRVPTTRSSQGFAGGTNPMDDNVASQFIPGQAADVLRGIGSGLADFALKFYAGMHRDLDPDASRVGNETKTFGDALHTQVQESTQRFKDSTSELGSYPLLSGFKRYSPSQEASALTVKDKFNNIRDLSERMSSVTEQRGPRDMVGNKKIGHQEYAGAHPAQPQDMDTGAFAQDIQALYKRLQPIEQNIKATYTQYTGVANSNLYDPRMKRGMQEYFGRQISDYNRRLLIDIQRAEGILSDKYGQKIDFSKKYDFGSALSKQ